MSRRMADRSCEAVRHFCWRISYAAFASPCHEATSGAASLSSWLSCDSSVFSAAWMLPDACCSAPNWTTSMSDIGINPPRRSLQRQVDAAVAGGHPAGGLGVGRAVLLAGRPDRRGRLGQGPLDGRLVGGPRLLDLVEGAPALALPRLLQHIERGHESAEHGLQRVVDRLELAGGRVHHGGFCLSLRHCRMSPRFPVISSANAPPSNSDTGAVEPRSTRTSVAD